MVLDQDHVAIVQHQPMAVEPCGDNGREVTGERIRDKIAASKQKGMWMGGWVPIGYDRKDRTLTSNETEAVTVRTIFDLFLKLKNVQRVQAELARLNLTTNPYATPRGRAVGGLSFARGHLYTFVVGPPNKATPDDIQALLDLRSNGFKVEPK